MLHMGRFKAIVLRACDVFINEEEHTIMAVTHADLALRPKKSNELGSRTGICVMVLTIFLGLCCFVLCIVAEATRSEATWLTYGVSGQENTPVCTYNSSGRTPLICSAVAFVGLAAAIVAAHGYLLVIVSKSPPPAPMYYTPVPSPATELTWHAGILFISTWLSFAVGEILLLVGIAVESGHLSNFSTPRPSCLILRQGIFSSAGVFALITVSLASCLYITALKAQTLMQEEERARREAEAVAAAAIRPSLQPESQETVVRENRNVRTLSEYLTGFTKGCDLV